MRTFRTVTVSVTKKRGSKMPMIEGKKFPYTKDGKVAAKKYAEKHEKTESKREREMEYGKKSKSKKK